MPSIQHELAELIWPKRRVLVAVLPGVALVMLHTAMLDLVAVDVTDALAIDKYLFHWITGAFVVGTAAGMASTAYVCGRLGMRRAFLLGLWLFTVCGTPAGFATRLEIITLLRLLQGCGGGLTLSCGMLITWREFPARRELAMAAYALGVYFPAVLGPALGGLLTYTLAWNWIFWSIAPLGLTAAALAERILPNDRGVAFHASQQGRQVGKPVPRFDFLGLVFFLGWVIPLVVVMAYGQYWGWTTSRHCTAWLILLGASLIAFAVHGIWGREPLFDLRTFAVRNYGLGILAKAFFSANVFGLIALLSAYMIDLRGYQWWQAGLVVGAALPGMALSTWAGLHFGSDANRKLRMLLGLAIMALVTWNLRVVDLYTSKFWIAGQIMIWSLGAGLVIVPVMVAIFEDLSPEQVPHCAGTFNFTRLLPAFLVTSLLGILLVQLHDGNFYLYRRDYIYNRPIVEQTQAQLNGHFTRRGVPGRQVPRHTQAELTRWLHVNAQATAFGTTLAWLAVVTALGLVPIACLRTAPSIADRNLVSRDLPA